MMTHQKSTDWITSEEMLQSIVTEGPFDSTFLLNSIAMCGADGDVGKWGVSTPVWVYDNEPRSKEITTRISDTIDRGDQSSSGHQT